jgi:ribosomal protein S18 acetylase RimI-like enzyme
MPEDIIIRAMEEADIPAALALWKAVFTPESSAANERGEIVSRYLARNPGLSTVATDAQGRLIGTLLCGHDGRRGSIFHVAVDPAFRRRGVARAMQQRALEALCREGIGSAFLLVTPRNPGSEEFWTSVGWEVVPDVRYVFRSL